LWKRRLLTLLCLLNLGLLKIAREQLRLEEIKINTFNDVEWVNDISKGLAHLPAFGVANEAMAATDWVEMPAWSQPGIHAVV
jgi:hypothetical protein